MKFLDNIQAAGHIYLHVGDNAAPSGNSDASPKRNVPNVSIPAAGKFLLYIDFAFLFDWRLCQREEKKNFLPQHVAYFCLKFKNIVTLGMKKDS